MPLKNNKVLSLIGLAMKAGAVASGEFSTEKAVKSQKAKLVIIAEDASKNTIKLFTNACTYYNTPLVTYGSKEQLGKALGKDIRASLAITNEDFYCAIMKQIESQQESMEV